MKQEQKVMAILGILALVYIGTIINNMPKGNLGYPANCYIITPYYMHNNVPVGIPNAKLTIGSTVIYSDENGDALFCGMTSQSEDRTVTIVPPAGYSPSIRTETLLGTWINGETNFQFTQTVVTTTTPTTTITPTTINYWQYNTCEQAGLKTQNIGVCSAKFMNNVAGGTYCYTSCENDTIVYKDLLILFGAIVLGLFIYKTSKHKNQ